MSLQQKACLSCGTMLSKLVRNETDSGWIKYNLDGSVHGFAQCKNLQKQKQGANKEEPRQLPKYFPVQQETTKASGITVESVFYQISNYRREAKESKEEILKILQEIATIVDRVAQNVTLLIEKVGYPKPEPVKKEEIVKVGDMKIPLSKIREQVEAKEDIPPPEEIKQELVQELPPTAKSGGWQMIRGWQMISTLFICHGCEGKKHNGWEKAGTKLCDDCKTNIEAQGQGEYQKIINEEEENPSINQLDTNNENDDMI